MRSRVKPPPRMMYERPVTEEERVEVHSATLPARSKIPSWFAPAGCEPTLQVWSPPFFSSSQHSWSFGTSSPQGKRRFVSTRAARSHSAEVGRRPPFQTQYAWAAPQFTQFTG